MIEEAQKNGAMPADIEKLLKKTGQTHYTFEELEVDLGTCFSIAEFYLKKPKKNICTDGSDKDFKIQKNLRRFSQRK